MVNIVEIVMLKDFTFKMVEIWDVIFIGYTLNGVERHVDLSTGHIVIVGLPGGDGNKKQFDTMLTAGFND